MNTSFANSLTVARAAGVAKRWRVGAALWAILSFASGVWASEPFRVEGRFLVDPNGDRVVLRGVNAMIIHWDRVGSETFPEVAKTGANACRIFWQAIDEVPVADLDAALQNCWDHQMIPVISLWDATGKWERFDDCMAYWLRPEVVEVLKRHEGHLLLNIANEAGDRNVTQEAFRAKYAEAVAALREAGLRMPLMIDAARWGRDESYLLENAAFLLEQDPLRSLIFSWHPWDVEQPASRYRAAMEASIEQDVCLVIGEFSRIGVHFKRTIDYRAILDLSQELSIGWLAWVWHCCGEKTDGHSITVGGRYGAWANGWGRELALEHPNGLRATSLRTDYIRQQGPGRPVEEE